MLQNEHMRGTQGQRSPKQVWISESETLLRPFYVFNFHWLLHGNGHGQLKEEGVLFQTGTFRRRKDGYRLEDEAEAKWSEWGYSRPLWSTRHLWELWRRSFPITQLPKKKGEGSILAFATRDWEDKSAALTCPAEPKYAKHNVVSAFWFQPDILMVITKIFNNDAVFSVASNASFLFSQMFSSFEVFHKKIVWEVSAELICVSPADMSIFKKMPTALPKFCNGNTDIQLSPVASCPLLLMCDAHVKLCLTKAEQYGTLMTPCSL